jgi:hypothetical protein
MPTQGSRYGEGSFLEYSFVPFLPKLLSDDWPPCAVKGGGGVVLLGKFSCYVTQLGCNTRTLGTMKTASWFWVGHPGSPAAQGSFTAARQTLRHDGESDLIWLFCISKLLFGYNLWHDVSCHALKPHITEVSMHRRADVAGAKYCTGLADFCVLGLFLLFIVWVKN